MRNLIIEHRRFLVVVVHVTLWAVGLGLALLLRFEFDIPRVYLEIAPKLLLLTLAARLLVHWRLGVFHGLWRYSSLHDLISLMKATTLSAVIVATVWAFINTGTFPRSILVLDYAFSILLPGGVRFGIRTLREAIAHSARQALPLDTPRKRILVLGAGDAGEMLMREITRAYANRYEPIGFLDDSPAKQREQIHGVPVIGQLAEVGRVIERERIDEVILAIPSMTGPDFRRIVDLCRPFGVALRTVPSVDRIVDGRVTVGQLAEVKIDDLLGRAPVKLDMEEIARFLEGRTVLVTGAGGSIGSELCRQICRFAPARMLLVEQAENSLFEIHRALLAEFPDVPLVPYVADVCDAARLETIFERDRPAVVFHAAAHKHVPMMETNPGEAIKNNVFGTKAVADTAAKFNVETFVMVSTDKAVNPTSIMGVSKRTAEIYVQALSQRSQTRFVTVRFGNVLGSAGSVIPIFKQQIAAGGPVTVTHPDMCRYFMTIPEACQLILEAGTVGRGGEILILDMGEPVKIVDLARDLIRLSGFSEDEIAITFTGTRPGEKLFEELSVDVENATKTRHPKIFVGTFRPYPWDVVEKSLAEIRVLQDETTLGTVQAAFKNLVPEYAPAGSEPVLPPKPRPSVPNRPSRPRATVLDEVAITTPNG